MATTNPPPAAPKKSQYTVVNAVDHDNKRYEADRTITLDEETAAPLLACGAIVPKKGASE